MRNFILGVVATIVCIVLVAYCQMKKDKGLVKSNNYVSPANVSPQSNIAPVQAIPKKTERKPETRFVVYKKGKRGGCYYLNEKRKKVYVDESFCR